MTVQTEEQYRQRTHELTMRLAALELVTHVREMVADEYMRRRYKGDYEIDHYIAFRGGEPPPKLRHGALGRVLQFKDLDQKEATIRELVDNHIEEGDLPPHRLTRAESRVGEYLRLEWDIPLPTPQ